MNLELQTLLTKKARAEVEWNPRVPLFVIFQKSKSLFFAGVEQFQEKQSVESFLTFQKFLMYHYCIYVDQSFLYLNQIAPRLYPSEEISALGPNSVVLRSSLHQTPIDPPPRKLFNTKNNCYLNSIFQSLLTLTDDILSIIFNDYWFQYTRNHQDSRGPLLKCKWNSPLFDCKSTELLDLFVEFLRSEKNNTTSPIREFQSFIWHKWPQLGNGKQQDAHEVFILLIDSLHLGFVSKEEKEEFRISSIDGIDGIIASAHKAILAFRTSPIVDIFFSIQVMTKECVDCKSIDSIYSKSAAISLAIKGSISEALEEYFVAEEINGEHCSTPFCRAKTGHFIKRAKISRPSQLFVIHIKRYTFEKIARCDTSKIEIPEVLDLSQWLLFTDQSCSFSLASMCCHFPGSIDSINSGHYMAVVRRNTPLGYRWYVCNDDIISPPMETLPEFVVSVCILIGIRVREHIYFFTPKTPCKNIQMPNLMDIPKLNFSAFGAMQQLIFFSGSSHQELALSISKRLGLLLGRVELSTFSNGETSVEIGDSVRDKNVFILQSFDPPHSHSRLMELLIMISACKTASAGRVSVVLPLFPYAKQSPDLVSDELLRQSSSGLHYMPWRPRAGKLIANLLMTAGADHIITLDVHDPQCQGFFNIPFDNLKFQPLLVKWVEENLAIAGGDPMMIVSPDVGGARRATSMAQSLGIDFALIHDVQNSHHSNTNLSSKLVGEVKGRTVLLVDDIAITCKTLINAAEMCIKEGAGRVIALLTHAFFASSASESPSLIGISLLASCSSIYKIVVSNSLPNIAENAKNTLGRDKVIILDIAPLLAEAIRRIHYGEPVSYLFDRVAI